MHEDIEKRLQYFRFGNPWLWAQVGHAAWLLKLYFPSLPWAVAGAVCVAPFGMMGLIGVVGDGRSPDSYWTLRNPFLTVGITFFLCITLPMMMWG